MTKTTIKPKTNYLVILIFVMAFALVGVAATFILFPEKAEQLGLSDGEGLSLSLPDMPFADINEFREMVNYQRDVKVTVSAITANRDYLLHFIDSSTGKLVEKIRITHGEEQVLSLPPGKYHIKFASGSRWIDDQQLYGADTITRQTRYPMELSLKKADAKDNVLHLTTKFIGQLQPAKM